MRETPKASVSARSLTFFLLGVLGLTMVATVSGAAVGKGLAAAAIGLMLSQIGFPVASEEPRYWFEITYLIDGIPLIPVVLGLFAIPEMLDLAVRNRSIADTGTSQFSGLRTGIRDTLRNWWLVLRCSWIGIYIGKLPGLGGMIADWVAYGHAAQTCREEDGPGFGNGDVRGVIAPEAANNAVLGGALIPTVDLGIPGSASMAILLGAFTIKGLSPGRDMLGPQLDVTFSLVWMLIFANILGASLLMLWSRQVARLSFIDGHLIVPGVLFFVFMGAWMESPDIANWVTVLGVGIVGYAMKRGGWPRPALLLGFVLGPVMESALILAAQTFTWRAVLARPLALILVLILVGAVVLAVRSTLRARAGASGASETDQRSDGDPASLAFGLICLVLFIAAVPPALNWPASARLFPLVIAPVGAAMVLAALLRDLRAARFKTARKWTMTGEDLRAIEFFLWLVALIGMAALFGQWVALISLAAAYLWRWGGYRLPVIIAYGAGVGAVLILLYDRVLYVRWLEPVVPLF